MNQGMSKRKGVRIPCCHATVMETKAGLATALERVGRQASRKQFDGLTAVSIVEPS